jgi:hypothetical protein
MRNVKRFEIDSARHLLKFKKAVRQLNQREQVKRGRLADETHTAGQSLYLFGTEGLESAHRTKVEINENFGRESLHRTETEIDENATRESLLKDFQDGRRIVKAKTQLRKMGENIHGKAETPIHEIPPVKLKKKLPPPSYRSIMVAVPDLNVSNSNLFKSVAKIQITDAIGMSDQ